MSELDVEALKRLAEVATPRPWGAWIEGKADPFHPKEVAWGGSPIIVTAKTSVTGGGGDISCEDVEFIVALVNQLPAILAALEEREGLLRVHAVAGDAVDALLDLGVCPDPLCGEPNCTHVLPRLVAALAAIPAREAEEGEHGDGSDAGWPESMAHEAKVRRLQERISELEAKVARLTARGIEDMQHELRENDGVINALRRQRDDVEQRAERLEMDLGVASREALAAPKLIMDQVRRAEIAEARAERLEAALCPWADEPCWSPLFGGERYDPEDHGEVAEERLTRCGGCEPCLARAALAPAPAPARQGDAAEPNSVEEQCSPLALARSCLNRAAYLLRQVEADLELHEDGEAAELHGVVKDCAKKAEAARDGIRRFLGEESRLPRPAAGVEAAVPTEEGRGG